MNPITLAEQSIRTTNQANDVYASDLSRAGDLNAAQQDVNFSSKHGSLYVKSVYENISQYTLQAFREAAGASASSHAISQGLSNLAKRVANIDGQSLADYWSGAMSSLDGYIKGSCGSQSFLTSLKKLTTGFNEAAGLIQVERTNADREIGMSVEKVNALLEKLHDLNKRVGVAQGQSRINGQILNGIGDEQRATLTELQTYMNVDIDTLFTKNGQIHLSLSGHALLDREVHPLSFIPYGHGVTAEAILSPITTEDGADLTQAIISGNIQGQLQLRDTIYVQEGAQLDQIAEAIYTTLTATVPGRTIFTPLPTGNPGFASVFTVDPTADPRAWTGSGLGAGDKTLLTQLLSEFGDNGSVVQIGSTTSTLKSHVVDFLSHLADEAKTATSDTKEKEATTETLKETFFSETGVDLEEVYRRLTDMLFLKQALMKAITTIHQTNLYVLQQL